MQLIKEKQIEFARRIIESRTRILASHGFYGMLLMNAGLTINDSFDTAATDGKNIIFSPDFLDSLSDSELDFVMMHEIMHIALKHCFRDNHKDDYYANIADDIVVNSIILSEFKDDLSAISVHGNVSMHLTPNGKEGRDYTAEEVYNQLLISLKNTSNKNGVEQDSNNSVSNNKSNKKGKESQTGQGNQSLDNHSLWKSDEESKKKDEEWTKVFEDVCETLLIRDPNNSQGTIPLVFERMYEELKNPKLDWRLILNNFIQEEIVDYSFSPPDKRFDDSPFYLPAFNEKDEIVKNILFMIDTSGSMSDKLITSAYSEVKGALDQFNGKLCGYLGFFDAIVIDPVPFSDESELKIIKPKGGGGTSFTCVFEYVNEKMRDKEVSTIIMLTDGFAPYPDESITNGIPVLWVITNKISKPPFGKIARI